MRKRIWVAVAAVAAIAVIVVIVRGRWALRSPRDRRGDEQRDDQVEPDLAEAMASELKLGEDRGPS